MVSPDEALVDLLMSLFSADELRSFLRYGPEGEAVGRSLPGPTASDAEVADKAVMALRKRGIIDERFWERLVSARPNRRADIDGVLAPIVDARVSAKEIAATVKQVDRLYDQIRHVVEGTPPDPRGPAPWRTVVSHDAGDLVTAHQGSILQRVSAADLDRLPHDQVRLIRTYEKSMKARYKAWTKRYPLLASAASTILADDIRTELTGRVASMAVDLNAILDFLESRGLHLDDHYLHIRSLVGRA